MSRRVHRRRRSVITAKDLFCGAGGSTLGAKRAGVEVTQAANHWKLACRTYNKNHPNTDVHWADISNHHPGRFQRTDLLIASPECTTHSPAGGNRRVDLDPESEAALIRSRATMRDIPRFMEWHEYEAGAFENVVEVTRWGPNNDGSVFRHWLKELQLLGYCWRLVSLNSMHCWPTPQSRDRLYIVVWRKGNKAPDLDFFPPAPCPQCERVVESVQTWKPGAIARAIDGQPFGKYRTQYVFTCPKCRIEVTPFYYAALNAIDFSLEAERIGDRERPLKERTLERIRYGLERYGNRHLLIRTNFTSGLDTRVRTLSDPIFGQTASWLDGVYAPFGLASPPFVVPIQGGADRARSLAGELPTTVAECPTTALVSPFTVNISRRTDASKVRGMVDAMPSQTTQQEVGFVFNVAGRDASAALSSAMPTQETREKFAVALVDPAFIAVLRTHNRAKALDAPVDTIATGGGHHLIIQGAAQISMRDAAAMRVAGLDREFMVQGKAPQQALIQNAPFLTTIAYEQHARGSQVRSLDHAMASVTGNDRDGLVGPAPRIEDCYFRMLQPHEIGRAMAFPDSYQVEGNKRDQVKQFGNAVTPPAMDLIMGRIIESLGGTRAA